MKLNHIHSLYQKLLDEVKGIKIMITPDDVTSNFGYVTIFVEEKEYGMCRDALYEKLKSHNIFPRRYFYPLISQFPTYNCLSSAADSNLPVAVEMSQRVLCLPMYYGLEMSAVDEICKIIREK